MFIVNHRKIFYFLSGLLILASVFSLYTYGLKQGIDFKGGSLLEISSSQNIEQIKAVLPSSASIRSGGPNDYIVRLNQITEAEKNEILAKLPGAELKNFNTIGPTLGAEAVRKSILAIVLVLLAIILFITFAFRKVSGSISSWVYGLVVVIALLHDVVIPIGAFSVLGHFYGFEVDTLFVTALLVILGFSVHDSIVVFDRVRENLSNSNGKTGFGDIVGRSISETFARSINTSLTTLLAIAALYIWGPESTHHFALALLIGIAVGTYSSIFIGSPLLVTINKLKSNK